MSFVSANNGKALGPLAESGKLSTVSTPMKRICLGVMALGSLTSVLCGPLNAGPPASQPSPASMPVGNVNPQDERILLFEMGRVYELGTGVGKNEAKAVELYEKAAEKGHSDAQFRLAMMYEQGRGAPKDAKLAFKWYEAAAYNAVPAAEHFLAFYYGKGIGKIKGVGSL